MNRYSLRNNWLLAMAVILLAVLPLVFVRGEFSGADDQAETAITTLNPDYKSWFRPFWEPPSGRAISF